MRMFSEDEVRDLSPLLESLENDEPMVAAWRCQCQVDDSRRAPNWPRKLVGSARDTALHFQPPQRPTPGQVVILADFWSPATSGTLRPVMQELLRRGQPPFLITTKATRAFLSENLHRGQADVGQIIASVGFFKQRQLRQRASRLAKALREQLSDFHIGPIEPWLERGLILKEGVQSWIEGAGAAIVVADNHTLSKGFTLGAVSAEVSSYVLQHGLLTARYFPLHADRFICWGPYFIQHAGHYNVLPNRLLPLGCPRWDELPAMRHLPRDPEIRHRLGGNSNRPLILLISNAHAAATYPHHYEAYFDGVTRLLSSEVDVVVKLHPAEKDLAPYYEKVPADLMKKLHVVPPDIGLHQALHHVDTVYHVFSAAALEAMLLEVPVLFEKGYGDVTSLCDFPDFGGGKWTSPSEVVAQTQMISTDGQARKSFLHTQESFLDQVLVNRGKATQTVVDHILTRKSV